MAQLVVPLMVLGTVMTASGQLQQGRAARDQSQRQADASNFEAAQLEVNAGQERAASQRQAGEERRRSRIIQSRALALAGASGAGVSDPTVENIISGLAGEGAYRANVALYEGEERARQATMGAAGKRYEAATELQAGQNAYKASKIAALGTIFSGGATAAFYGKYGTPGQTPKTETSPTGPGEYRGLKMPGLYPYNE